MCIRDRYHCPSWLRRDHSVTYDCPCIFIENSVWFKIPTTNTFLLRVEGEETCVVHSSSASTRRILCIPNECRVSILKDGKSEGDCTVWYTVL